MTTHVHASAPDPDLLEISDGYREWYDSCPCCMSKAAPEIKQALDEEKAATHATS